MVTKSDAAINERIVQLDKSGWGILRIHDWLSGWTDFENLDNQIILVHICKVLHEADVKLSKKEITKCFNKFYEKKGHNDKRSYLEWIFRTFVDKQEMKGSQSKSIYTPDSDFKPHHCTFSNQDVEIPNKLKIGAYNE